MAPVFSSSKVLDDPLCLVVEVNEGIRRVVHISRQVNLVALNAMVAAKQAGAQARGFSVVSAELRRFSGELSQQMQELDQFIYSLVHAVAEAARVRRHRHHLDGIDENTPGSGFIASAKRNIDVQQQRIDATGSERWGGLRQRLERALRLCGTGVSLSRAAKIEAVHGSARACDLRQVAEEVEVAITAILGTLRQLRGDITK